MQSQARPDTSGGRGNTQHTKKLRGPLGLAGVQLLQLVSHPRDSCATHLPRELDAQCCFSCLKLLYAGTCTGSAAAGRHRAKLSSLFPELTP